VRSALGLAADRGLHYGDGLFETIRYVGARAPLWDWHQQRLAGGCARLGLPEPNWPRLQRRLERAAGAHDASTVKLIWTAGSAPRGYARPDTVAGRALVQAHGWLPEAPRLLNLRWCQTRLAVQPALAGLKHLNRLEQVLARAEWRSADIDEGLMLDMQGRVIAATSANLFIRAGGRWLTPDLSSCGIAGIARRWLMAQCAVVETALDPEQIKAADAVVLSNAVRGPRQVGALEDRRWSADTQVQDLQAAWEQQFAAAADAS
jgi:4-amino-4-deoxychorismate lyase